MNAAAEIRKHSAKRRAKSGRRLLPIHLTLRRLVDPDTGVEIKAFSAAFKADRMICKERRYKVGATYRADISESRNPKFNNLVHGLGELVRRNVDGYQDCKDAHDVIKRLQRKSGVCCEEQEIYASPEIEAVLAAARAILGDAAARMLSAVLPSIKTIKVRVAQSLAFDSLDEAEFYLFWRGICRYLITTHWGDLTEDVITEMANLLPESEV